MSKFIGRVRNALGLGHNYLYLARDEGGEWERVHGVLGEEGEEYYGLRRAEG